MPQFTTKISLSHVFTIAMQRTIVDVAFNSGVLSHWCSNVDIKQVNGMPYRISSSNLKYIKTPVDAYRYGGIILLTEAATSHIHPFTNWQLSDGIKLFCYAHECHPCTIIENMTPAMADEIIQYGLFNKVKY